MSKLENFKDEFKKSFTSLLGMDAAPVDEEASINNNKTVAKKISGVVSTTTANKSRQIMDDIARAIDSDEAKDPEDDASVTRSNRIRSKDYFKGSKKSLPSASSLVNQPLDKDCDRLEGEEAIKYHDRKELSNVTSRDLQRSFAGGLNDIDEPAKLKKSKSRSKNNLSGSRKLGSALSLINAPPGDSYTLRGADAGGSSSFLGITAKDLRRSFDHGLDNGLYGKSKSKSTLAKSKGSIANLVNQPLNEQFGAPDYKSVPLKDMSLNRSVGALINGPERFYTATEADRKRNQEQTATIDIDVDTTQQPLMSGVEY